MKVVTANSLTTGEVVFWNAGRWVVSFSDGERIADDEAAAQALVQAEAQSTVVVAAYLIDVENIDGHWVPVSFRERLRALGPSNTPQHGKQADGDADVEALVAATSAARSTGRVKLIRR
jgi:sulfite reductase (NADPH) hemoprotein beta-component